MKIRNSFISNSSSASFIIAKDYLTESQYNALLDLYEYRLRYDDDWDIYEDGSFIRGYTIMDNGQMSEYMDDLDIPQGVVDWGE